jgi:hypothetical protein
MATLLWYVQTLFRKGIKTTLVHGKSDVMLKIQGDEIFLTRGDSARIECKLDTINTSGEVAPYDVSNDTAVFTVREDFDSEDVVFSHEAIKTEDGSSIIAHIVPTDTNGIEYGTYVYDFQITTSAGDVYTPIVGKLHITNEVTMP